MIAPLAIRTKTECQWIWIDLKALELLAFGDSQVQDRLRASLVGPSISKGL